MYYNISNISDIKMMKGGTIENLKRKNVIILVRMNECVHCDMMKPSWNQMIDQTRNNQELDVLEIEKDMMIHLTNMDREFFKSKFDAITGFPTVLMNNSQQRNIPFQNQRTTNNLIDFIKATSTPPVFTIAKKAPAKKAPVKKAPAKKAPVKKAPVKKADKKKSDKKK